MSDDSHVSPAAALAGRSTGRVRWRVAPEWQPLLIGPRGLRLDEWLAQGRVHVVKHGSHRTVYRVDLPERTFFLKHYRVLASLSAATHLLRGSAARREWRNALEVRRRRVPTATPVALGERYRGGLVRDSYFISEAIADSCTLDRYTDECLPALSPGEQARTRRTICLALARLCADAHEAGVYHTDFHCGNVLVGIDSAAGAPRLHLIDLPRMWFSKPLSWRRSRAGLAMFAAAWLDRATRSEKWRFWRAYLAARPSLRLEHPRLAAEEVLRASRRHAQKILRDRDKRSLRNNRDYYRQSTSRGVGYGVADLASDRLATLVRDPARKLHEPDAQVIKQSPSSVVVKTWLELDGAAVPVAYKRARYKQWWKALVALFRRSRSLRAWYLGHALLERSIATARPLFVCEPRGGLLRWDSYLATEWIAGDHLHQFARRLAVLEAEQRRRQTRRCAAVLGRLLGRMHQWNIAHRDLKAANLMVAQRHGELSAYLIDLDGVRLLRRISPRRRARNLARLATSLEAHPWVSRADRMRFLRAYLRAAPLERRDWKWLWRVAGRHSRQLSAQMRRSGREVL